jgi:hypothetical protein
MEHGKRSMNYWPGFVDALSNMVMVMIFVVLVFTVALVYFSMNVAQNRTTESDQQLVDRGAAAIREQMSAENEGLREALANQVNEVDRLNAELAREQKSSNSGKPVMPSAVIVSGQSKAQTMMPGPESIVDRNGVAVVSNDRGATPPTVAGSNDMISITFQNEATELGESAAKTLQQALAPALTPDAHSHFEIIAEISGTDGYTGARRRAYFRTLSLRNALMQYGVKTEVITTKIVDRSGNDPGAHVFIRVFSKQ